MFGIKSLCFFPEQIFANLMHILTTLWDGNFAQGSHLPSTFPFLSDISNNFL
jgi:hypothetical protein